MVLNFNGLIPRIEDRVVASHSDI